MLSLKRLDYLNRDQLQQIHDLKSNRNAQRVLKDMDHYLSAFRDDGQNIYYLNKEGRSQVNCDKVRKKLSTASHYIMRNDVYIHCGMPEGWQNEIRITSRAGKEKIVVVTDAHFVRNGKHYLVEIDHRQTMKKNRAKIDKYRRLTERNAFKGMPRLIWVTTTPYRREMLLKLCDGLDVQVYLPSDFK